MTRVVTTTHPYLINNIYINGIESGNAYIVKCILGYIEESPFIYVYIYIDILHYSWLKNDVGLFF